MSDAVTLEIIKTTGIILTAIISTFGLIYTVKSNRKQDIIHKQIDGQQDLLLEATGKKERAAGKAEGKTEQRNQGKETAAEVIKQIKDDTDIELKKT